MLLFGKIDWRDLALFVCAMVAAALLLSAHSERQLKSRRDDLTGRYGLDYMVDYVCYDDCELFRSGARWAETRDIDDGGKCPRTSSFAFYQGCLATVAYNADLFESEMAAALSGEEIDTSSTAEPWEPLYMQRARERRQRLLDERIARRN